MDRNTHRQVLPSPPTSPTENKKRSYEEDDEEHINKKYKFDLSSLKRYLVDKKGSPNRCDEEFKRSLLSWCCVIKSVEGVKYLLSNVHLDINLASGTKNTTALHEASLNGFDKGIELLLEHPDIDINSLDRDGRTPVHCAIQTNQAITLKLLLDSGARIDLCHQGKLPIHLAILNGFHQCVEILLSNSSHHRNNPNLIDMIYKENVLYNMNSIELAVMAGYTETLRLLLKHNDQKLTENLIQLAINWNRIECLQLLLKNDCPVDQEALLVAVKQRKIDMVRELTQAGVNPCLSNGQNHAFLYASNHGFMDMIPCLLTLNTSKDCIQQAILFATPLGFRDQLTKIIVHTLKSLSNKSP